MQASTDGGDEEFLTVNELAAWFKVPVQTVYSWNSKGTGPKPLKFGRHVRYRRSEALRWSQERGK
jgi:predicted DNA-binding transcriptional regulator AlpA